MANQADFNFPAPAHAWRALIIVALAVVCAFIDRQLINLFVEPIRASLSLTDTQISLVQGLAFVIFYVALGYPCGYLVDRANRRNLLICGILLWSVMTMASGLATDFWSLFVARMGVGAGEAIAGPAAYSIVADCFEQRRRGRAIAVIGTAAPVGTAASLFLGAIVLNYLPDTRPYELGALGQWWNWQIAFLAAGGLGFIVALLMLLVSEPKRQELSASGSDGPARPLFGQYMRRHWKPVGGVIVAFVALQMVMVAIAAWTPAMFVRSFGVPAAEVGLIKGLFLLIGIIPAIASGFVSDALNSRVVGGRLRVLWFASVAALPFLASWTLASSALVAWCLLFPIIMATHFGVATFGVMLQDIVPNDLRGRALGVFYVLQGVFAPGIAPLLVALVTERALGGPQFVWLSLPLVTVPLCLVVLAISIAIRRDYAALRRQLLDGSPP